MKALAQAMPGALLHLLQTMPLSDGKVTFAWKAAVGPALERATEVKLVDRTLLVETTIGDFWNVTRSQIYRELRSLEELGLVEAGETGARERRPIPSP